MPSTSVANNVGVDILSDLYMYTSRIANVYLVGNQEYFVLIDAGMPKSGDNLIAMIKDRFGTANPKAIILTHGHFDHVGGIIELTDRWNVPIYAHELELPFLTGKQSYPKPDASVEGGIIAKMSPMFPHEPINLADHVHALLSDGSVPYMDDFYWLHTPGHSPGHVSFFRESDKTLIAGDAFITVKQDELYKVLTQNTELNGPPRYLTTDWDAAKNYVEKLRDLAPSLAVTGHGKEIGGEKLTRGLDQLVSEFERIAVPDYGKYIDDDYLH